MVEAWGADAAALRLQPAIPTCTSTGRQSRSNGSPGSASESQRSVVAPSGQDSDHPACPYEALDDTSLHQHAPSVPDRSEPAGFDQSPDRLRRTRKDHSDLVDGEEQGLHVGGRIGRHVRKGAATTRSASPSPAPRDHSRDHYVSTRVRPGLFIRRSEYSAVSP